MGEIAQFSHKFCAGSDLKSEDYIPILAELSELARRIQEDIQKNIDNVKEKTAPFFKNLTNGDLLSEKGSTVVGRAHSVYSFVMGIIAYLKSCLGIRNYR